MMLLTVIQEPKRKRPKIEATPASLGRARAGIARTQSGTYARHTTHRDATSATATEVRLDDHRVAAKGATKVSTPRAPRRVLVSPKRSFASRTPRNPVVKLTA